MQARLDRTPSPFADSGVGRVGLLQGREGAACARKGGVRHGSSPSWRADEPAGTIRSRASRAARCPHGSDGPQAAQGAPVHSTGILSLAAAERRSTGGGRDRRFPGPARFPRRFLRSTFAPDLPSHPARNSLSPFSPRSTQLCTPEPEAADVWRARQARRRRRPTHDAPQARLALRYEGEHDARAGDYGRRYSSNPRLALGKFCCK